MKKKILATFCTLMLCAATQTFSDTDFSQYGLYLERLNHLENVTSFDAAKTNAKYVVFKFSANWCGPCQQLTSIMQQLAVKFPEVLFVEIEIDKFSQLASNNKIKRIPTVILFKDGVKVHRSTGAQTKTYWTDVIQNSFEL